MEIRSGANGNMSGSQPAGKEALAARKVARDFESLFVGMMLKSMRETVGKDKLTDGGHGEDMYRSLLDQEYAKALSEHGGIGLAGMLERQLVTSGTSGSAGRGMSDYGTTGPHTKTEVTYENR